MLNKLNRINSDLNICGGQPCIKNTRIRVLDILELLSNGLSFSDILLEFPNIEIEDIKASIKFASKNIEHPVIEV